MKKIMTNEIITCHEKRINYMIRRLKTIKKLKGTIRLSIKHEVSRAWKSNLFFQEEKDKKMWVQEKIYHYYFEPHYNKSFKVESYEIVEVKYGCDLLVAKCTIDVEELARVLYERYSNFDDMILTNEELQKDR